MDLDAASPQPPRHSPLHAEHEALGATFTDFGGWSMPVRYGSDLAEHHAVRAAAGLFDVSHMAELRVAGPEAAAFLDAALTLDASALPILRAKYALLLSTGAGVLDDLIVYRIGPDEFLVVANAGNRAIVVAALAERLAGHDATLVDETDDTALIAVQGPAAQRVVAAAEGLDVPGLAGLRGYAATPGAFAGEDVLVARTGYTGEDGFELFLPVGAAPALWRALLAAGATPCGLAARDTLRLEAGMPLHGHELGPDIRPEQAGLGWAVPLGTKRADFVGRAALEGGPAPGARRLVGLVSEGRRAGRAGHVVRALDGVEVGVVTSGALSPTLGHPIAIAYVDPDAGTGAGTELAIDVRGTLLPARVVPLPFLPRPEQRGA